jgi:hypothetical protein
MQIFIPSSLLCVLQANAFISYECIDDFVSSGFQQALYRSTGDAHVFGRLDLALFFMIAQADGFEFVRLHLAHGDIAQRDRDGLEN